MLPDATRRPWAQPALPTTLYLSDGFGTVTLTGVGGGSSGTANRTASQAWTDCGPATTTGVNVPVDVQFDVSCASGGLGQWQVSIRTRVCAGAVSPYVYAAGGFGTASVGDLNGTCRPFNKSGSVPTTGIDLGQIYGAAAAITVIE